LIAQAAKLSPVHGLIVLTEGKSLMFRVTTVKSFCRAMAAV
jgi:hypothetical protein